LSTCIACSLPSNGDPSCSALQFACSNRCIPLTWQCDGDKDCTKGEDEKGCSVNCLSTQFRCADGTRCIPTRWQCDGSAECDDGSDELDCSRFLVDNKLLIIKIKK